MLFRATGAGLRRRSWSAEEKRRIVGETEEPGASVSAVARRYEINATMPAAGCSTGSSASATEEEAAAETAAAAARTLV